MNITALLLLLGLMGAGCRSIICPERCSLANYTHQYFKHLSDLQNKPWKLEEDKEANRVPESIMFAKCTPCTNGMMAKPIYVQISVFKKLGLGEDKKVGGEEKKVGGDCKKVLGCRCPFELAVGCTCA